MPELFDRLMNSWKKNVSFLWVLILFISFEIPYITSVEGTNNQPWYQCINYVYVAILSLPALIALLYIIVMRLYMPKAKKGTLGIAFYVINANSKQYEAINKKFIGRFQKALSAENPDYSVIVIDDYHSQKYYSKLSRAAVNGEGEYQARILNKRRCRAAILIDCENGGDQEELFCHMTISIGISYQSLPQDIRDLMVNDISQAFAPIQDIDIMKISETPDFSQHSFSLEIVYKYILASTAFHCGDHLGALAFLETIERRFVSQRELPDAVIPINNVLNGRIAACHRVQALLEYENYCVDRKEEHLILVQNAINDKHCRSVYDNDNKVLEGICSFVLDRDVKYALECMDKYSKKDPVIRFNKVFLMLYEKCTTNNVFRAYNLYKSFESLAPQVQEQIESFTFHEYQKNPDKKQLLLILFLIYDIQNNNAVLAKRCLDQFCQEFKDIVDGDAASIFCRYKKKYNNVIYDEQESYSI